MSKYKNKNDTIEYWIERAGDIKNRNLTSTGEIIEKLNSTYQQTAIAIENEMMAFLMKYSDKNQISYEEAQKLLTKVEITEYQRKMKRLRNKNKMHKGAVDVSKEIDELIARNEITRMQALLDEVNIHMKNLSIDEEVMVENFLVKQYQDNHEEQIKMLDKAFGVESAFRRPTFEAVLPIIQYPHSGEMFSTLIWKANDKLVQNLKQTLTFGMVRGHSIDKMAKMLNTYMTNTTDHTYKHFDLNRIVRTESAFIQERAKQDANLKYGIDKYIVISANDKRSCQNCKKHHHMTYIESNRVNGLNAPPFHPQCRCTTAPYVDDAILDFLDSDADSRHEQALKKLEEKRNKAKMPKEEPKIDSAPPIEANWKKVFNKMDWLRVQKFEKVKDFTKERWDEFNKICKKRLDDSPRFTKELWNEFADNIEFETLDSKHGQFYRFNTRNIYYKFTDDYKSPKGKFDTFFHEIGHLLDHASNNYDTKRRLSTQIKFAEALREEGNNYIEKIIKELDIERNPVREKKVAIFEYLTTKYDDETLHAVSDLIEGATEGRYHGGWGHSRNYWKSDPFLIGDEAFAHFYSSTINNPKSLELIKEIYPKSYDMWVEMVEEMLEKRRKVNNVVEEVAEEVVEKTVKKTKKEVIEEVVEEVVDEKTNVKGVVSKQDYGSKPRRPSSSDFDGGVNSLEYQKAKEKYRQARKEYKVKREKIIDDYMEGIGEPIFKTKKEVKDWAKKIGIEVEDELLEWVDYRVFNDVKPIIEEYKIKHPSIFEWVDNVTGEKYKFKLGTELGGSSGGFMSGSHGILFNKSTFADYRRAVDVAVDYQLDAFTTHGDGTIKSLFHHELGHVVDSALNEKYFIDEWNIDGSLKIGGTQKRAKLERELTKLLDWDDISEYGGTNEKELFAEAWSELKSSRNPSKFAKKFKEILEKEGLGDIIGDLNTKTPKTKTIRKIKVSMKSKKLSRELERLLKDEIDDIPKPYFENIDNKLRNAPDFVKDLWEKYDDKIDIETLAHNGTSHFDRGEKKLFLNLKDDLEPNGKNSGDTLFHEIGHLFDIKGQGEGSSFSYRKKDFAKTLKKEAKEYVNKICEMEGAKTTTQRKGVIFNDLTQNVPQNARADISDIIGGATKGTYEGAYGHGREYWRDDENLPNEAFAQMFSATINNPDSLKEIQKRLPNSYKLFVEICKEMAK